MLGALSSLSSYGSVRSAPVAFEAANHVLANWSELELGHEHAVSRPSASQSMLNAFHTAPKLVPSSNARSRRSGHKFSVFLTQHFEMKRWRSKTQDSTSADKLATERRALAELQDLCRKHSVTWPKSELAAEGAAEAGSDESNLLRYLRARRFDVSEAFKQYEASAKWRHAIQLEKTYDDVDVAKFETIRRLQPQWTGRKDATGVPIMVYVVSQVRAEDILALHRTDPDLSSVFLAAEYVTQFVQPLCGKLQNERITTSINIIDLSNVGLPTFWRLRNLLSTASTMATAHYPETVKKIYVVGAPQFFPTIWKFVNAWFDPETTRKIFVLQRHERTEVLRKDLASENLPRRFGGDLEWEFGMFPVLTSDAQLLCPRLTESWVNGPLRFLNGPDKPRIIAVGSHNGELRREEL